MLIESKTVEDLLSNGENISEIDSSKLNQLVEQLDGPLWKLLTKWIEDHAVDYAVSASVRHFKTLEERGLCQAQTEAYLSGLRFVRGLDDAIRRERDRRIRAVRTQQEPPVPSRRTGVRSPSEFATLYNTLFGEGPQGR